MMIKQKMEKSSNNLRLPLVILIVGGILTFIAPYVFTAKTFIDRFDFTKTGNIGDTIGGITSPIVGLMGASLLFYSIILQYRANKQQDKAMLNQSHAAILQDVFRQISDSYNDVNNSSSLEQSYELERLAELANKPIPNKEVNILSSRFLNQINYVSTQFEILFKMLNHDDLIKNDFPLLELYKEKAIRLLNLFIEMPIARIVFGSGTFISNKDGKTEFPRNHLIRVEKIINKWGGEYIEMQLLSSYLSLLSEGDIELPQIEEN